MEAKKKAKNEYYEAPYFKFWCGENDNPGRVLLLILSACVILGGLMMLCGNFATAMNPESVAIDRFIQQMK